MSIRRMLRVASIMLGSLGAKQLALAGTGELGENVEQARKTEFFRWFHLEESGRTGSAVHFKPSAEKFRRLVTLNLSLDSRQRLIGAELVLSGRSSTAAWKACSRAISPRASCAWSRPRRSAGRSVG